MVNCDIIKGGLKAPKSNWTLDSGAVWTLTDLLLDIVGHVGHFVQQTNGLVHPLIDHTQVGQNLQVGRGRSVCFNTTPPQDNLCMCQYLRTDLCGLLGVDGPHVLVVFHRVLPVLLLCAHVLLQQVQHLAGLQRDQWNQCHNKLLFFTVLHLRAATFNLVEFVPRPYKTCVILVLLSG